MHTLWLHQVRLQEHAPLLYSYKGAAGSTSARALCPNPQLIYLYIYIYMQDPGICYYLPEIWEQEAKAVTGMHNADDFRWIALAENGTTS